LRTLEIIVNDNTVPEWLQEGTKRELLFLKSCRNEKEGNPVLGVL
jgi:hypothetical protein